MQRHAATAAQEPDHAQRGTQPSAAPTRRARHAPTGARQADRAATRYPAERPTGACVAPHSLGRCTEASDNTIDTDGKGLEAAKNPSHWHDNVIYSNASLTNANPEPDPEAPIAGVDSRPSQGQPTVATESGHKVVHRGVVDETVRNGTRAAQRFSLEDDESA